MSEPHRWHEPDSDVHSIWRRVFNRDWEGADLSESCPVCNQRTLHRWYHQEDNDARTFRGVEFSGRGRLWEWCSTCRTFEYYPDGFVPTWWEPSHEVDASELGHNPDFLERFRQERRTE